MYVFKYSIRQKVNFWSVFSPCNQTFPLANSCGLARAGHGRTDGYLHDLDNGAGELGGGAFRVMLALEDAVEELATLAELHDEVHTFVVLARLAQAHHPARAGLRHAPHDLHLAPHVVRVGPDAPQEQPLPPERLACQSLPRGGVLAPSRDAELAAPELRAEPIPSREVRVDGAGVTQDGALLLPALPATALLLPLLACDDVVVVRGAARVFVVVAGVDGEDGGGTTASAAQHL